MGDKIGVGLIGSQFISTIHAEALKSVVDAEILAVTSPTEGHARDFATKHHIPHHFTSLDQMLAMDDIDMVVIGAPNFLHCDVTLEAAKAGKHVVVEKPLCLNLAEADRMIEKPPLVTGEDGRAVLEVILAAYESAGTGRKVRLPFVTDVDKPYKLWKK